MDDVKSDRAYAVLSGTLEAVHGQLQFAETKNAALLAATLTLVVGITAILVTSNTFPMSVTAWIFVTCVGLAAASLTSLDSFIPVMGAGRHSYSRGSSDAKSGADREAEISTLNLAYWEDIAKFTPTEFGLAIFASLGISDRPTRLHSDLANQGVTVAGIAGRKFRRFDLAARIAAASAIAPAFLLVTSWLLSGFKFL